MKYKLFKLKVNDPDDIELPDGTIVTSATAHPEYVGQDPKDWKATIYGLEPVKKEDDEI